VTLRAYVSDAALLPDLLVAYRDAIRAEAETAGGAIRRQIRA
jgi:hypothetical protein